MKPTLADVKNIHQMSDCLVTAEEIDAALVRMAEGISARIADQLPLVLCVMNGGFIPAAELMLHLEFPLEVDYLHATRYGMNTEGQALEWRAHPNTEVADRTVLVIDDIFDQGHTLAAICQYLREAGAREVLSAVVVNKRHARKVDFSPDFIGVEVEDRFLYGYGMDYRGYLRNVKGIYALKEL